MAYTRDPRVDSYIDGLPGWQQEICQQVRDLVHAADPEVTETIKRTVQPYFVLQGNICARVPERDVRPDHREQPGGRLAEAEAEPIAGRGTLAVASQ